MIPAIDYVYFDPADGAYHTTSSAPLAVQVTQGKLALPAPPVATGTLTGTEDTPAQPLALKPMGGALATAVTPLTGQPWYWLLWLMPLAALTGTFAWQRRQVHLVQNAAAIRSSRAPWCCSAT